MSKVSDITQEDLEFLTSKLIDEEFDVGYAKKQIIKHRKETKKE